MGINDKPADRSALFAAELADLVRRVEKPPVGMDGEKTRAGGFGGELRNAGFTARGIEAGNINPFTLRARVGAEIDEKLIGRRPGGLRALRWREAGTQCEGRD